MREFSSLHPLALCLYFISIFALAIVTLQPIMVLIFLFCTTLFYIQTCGWEVFVKGISYKIIILVVLALSNPLFVHQGITILGYLNGNPITLEALLYGMNFACMMLGIWNLCACYQTIMNSEKFIYLFGCILPSFALIVTMSLRLIAKFKKQLSIIKDTQNMLAIESVHKSYIVKARELIEILSILITWAFETSLIGADSMKARGYGSQSRKNFHNYHMGKRDIIFMFTCCIMNFIVFTAYFIEYQNFYFYPHIVDVSFDSLSLAGYISYTLYLLLPYLLQRWEEQRWKSLISTM